jgi:hypothetical protein
MLAALGSPLRAQQDALAGSATGFPWDEVAAAARNFVSQESPDSVWPFERAGAQELAKSERKVFLHYFTPFPLSFDNKPLDDDYYRRQYLERAGENGKFAHVGGYLRQRPLGAGTLPGKHWQAVNATIDVLRAERLGADGFGVDLQQLDGGRYWDNDPLHVITLGLRRELADRHVFDHAAPQRAHGLVGHGDAPVLSEGCEPLISRQDAPSRYPISRATRRS